MPTINLIVIRSRDLDAALEFYQRIGLEFVRERHGTGPEHLSCLFSEMVFEIYPDSGDFEPSERIGFAVEDVASVIDNLCEADVLSPARLSPWGLRAVAVDPDGRKVELTQK